MNIATSTLELFRRDFAKADTVSGDVFLDMWNMLRPVPGDQRDVYVKGNTGLGVAVKVNEGSPSAIQTPLQLPQLTLSQTRRAASWGFTVEMQAFDVYGKVEEMGMEAKRALMRAKELDATNLLFNNARDSAYAIATGAALHSDSHTIAGATFDNLASAASLSESALETMVTMMFQQKDAKNQPMLYDRKFYLCVGPALALTAQKIVKSTQTLGSADNDANVVSGFLTDKVLPFATSTTAYALYPVDNANIHAYKAVRTESKNTDDTDKDGNVEFVKAAIYEVGVHLPYNTVGNAGA